MKHVKYILECIAYGIAVAIVVHGMIALGSRMTTGVWLDEGGKYKYAVVASVAMFGSLYALFDTLNKKVSNKKWYQYKYAKYLLFSLFVVFPAISWGVYKFTYTGPLKLTVIAERQPLFVLESDGFVENSYKLKLVNETNKDIHVAFSAASDMPGQLIIGAEKPLLLHHGRINEYTIFIEVPEQNLRKEITAIDFKVQSTENPEMHAQYKTVFNGPKPG